MKSWHPWLIMWLGLVLSLLAIAIGLAWGDTPPEQWKLAARYTARIGFLIFILAYIARPLHQLKPSPFSKALLARRKWIGLGFAMSHTVHLFALIEAHRQIGEAPDIIAIIGGGFAYMLLYAMAFTSNNAAMKAMGIWWKRLHILGIHYLWIVFTQAYIGRVFEPDYQWTGIIFGTIAITAAGLRLAVWRNTSNKARSTASKARKNKRA